MPSNRGKNQDENPEKIVKIIVKKRYKNQTFGEKITPFESRLSGISKSLKNSVHKVSSDKTRHFD